MARFKVKVGRGTLPLPEGAHDIGRLADCWLTLDDDLASRQHARLHVEGSRVFLEDLGSRNGTYVNRAPVVARLALHDGDRIQIGRQQMVLLAVEPGKVGGPDDNTELRRTLAPGEDARLSSVIGQLVAKSLRAGHVKEAERYTTGLANQLSGTRVTVDHPAAAACISCLLDLAEHTSRGLWIDRVFALHRRQGWMMEPVVLERIRSALDRIPRVPGPGILAYEDYVRQRAREGTPVPMGLLSTVAELADAYGQRE